MVGYLGIEKIIKIPNGIKRICLGAFSGASFMEQIILPDSIEEIEHYAFHGCYNLETIKLKNVTKIGVNAFSYCEKLKEVELNIIEFINDRAFYCCS